MLNEVFQSKRNTVVLSPEGEVVKDFPSAEKAALERAFLQKLAQGGVPVCKVLRQEGSSLVLQRAEGETLADLLGTLEARNAPFSDLCERLVCWFERFYTAVDHARTGEVRGDVNCRNFIVSEEICGVDFEEHVFGTKAQDIGRLAAFILAYDPSFTAYKKAFADCFLATACGRLGVAREDALRARTAEFCEMRKRRAGFFVPPEFL